MDVDNESLADAQIISAYVACRDMFYEYYGSAVYDGIVVKSFKKLSSVPNVRASLHELIDDCVMFRLNITNDIPSKSNTYYAFTESIKYNLVEELDKTLNQIVESLVYCAYPWKIVKEFKNKLLNEGISSTTADDIIDGLVNDLVYT